MKLEISFVFIFHISNKHNMMFDICSHSHTQHPTQFFNSFIYFNIFSIVSNVCIEKKNLQQRGWWINNRWTKKEGKNITLVYHFILSPAVFEFISFMFASLFQDHAISIYYEKKRGENQQNLMKWRQKHRCNDINNCINNENSTQFVCVYAFVAFAAIYNMWKINSMDGNWLK